MHEVRPLAGRREGRRRHGRGRVRLLRKHRDTFSPAGFIPGAFVAGLVAGPALCFLLPLLWFVYGGALALYVALVLAFSASIAARHGRPAMLPRLAAVFATVHIGAGVGLWWEILAARPPVKGRR